MKLVNIEKRYAGMPLCSSKKGMNNSTIMRTYLEFLTEYINKELTYDKYEVIFSDKYVKNVMKEIRQLLSSYSDNAIDYPDTIDLKKQIDILKDEKCFYILNQIAPDGCEFGLKIDKDGNKYLMFYEI